MDYNQIAGWWRDSGEAPPPRELIPEDTYVLENDKGVPWICLSLILFNVPWAWSIGLVSNPNLPKEGRRDAVKHLWDFVARLAKVKGAKYLYCQAPNEKLEARYKEMGFTVTKKNVSLMLKEL